MCSEDIFAMKQNHTNLFAAEVKEFEQPCLCLIVSVVKFAKKKKVFLQNSQTYSGMKQMHRVLYFSFSSDRFTFYME